jgi:hypothetical protein
MDASRVNSFFQEHIDWELLVEERKYLRNFAGNDSGTVHIVHFSQDEELLHCASFI